MACLMQFMRIGLNTDRKDEKGQEGDKKMMGGWLIWLILGGLFIFIMFRGGGCCGGHGGHDKHRDEVGKGGPGNEGIHPKDH